MESELPETIDGRWRYIEHTATHTRVMIRLQRQTWRTPPEVRITGVIHLPRISGDSITSQQLRELPIARIETNINKRLFDMERVATITGDRIKLPSGRRIKEREIAHKITPEPRQNPTSTSSSPSNTTGSPATANATPPPKSPESTTYP